MARNPVVWFEVYVQDMDRARRFYESVFQVSMKRLDTPDPGLVMWTFPSEMSRYGSSGSLVKVEGVSSGGNGTLVYFHCEDCAVEEGRVAASGGRVERPKMSIGQYGAVSLVFDTEGNRIGLHSMA